MATDSKPIGNGYALWAMPEEPMFRLLAGKISRLSQKFSTPLFEPHVTLLGGINLSEEKAAEKSASLARMLRPFHVELGEIGYSHEYFRCLFATVVPPDPITKSHQTARETFDLWGEAAYMPHLSLLHGKLRIETQKAIAAAPTLPAGLGFKARRLMLYRVSGSPQEWKRIPTFDLR